MRPFFYSLALLSFLSLNASAQWVRTNGPNRETHFSRKVVAATEIDTVLLIATNRDSLFRSPDHGASWQYVRTPWLGAVRFFSQPGAVGVAVTANDTLYLTKDEGVTWTRLQLFNLSTARVTSLLVSGSQIYVGTVAGKVYRSLDFGATWSDKSSGLPATAINSILMRSNRLTALTELGGIFASTNLGTSWATSQTGFTSIGGNVAYDNNPSFYVSSPDGVFRSTDGVTWQKASQGLPTATVTSFANDLGLLVAGTDGAGIFATTDDGVTWIARNNGLTDLKVKTIFPSDRHTIVVLGASGQLFEFNTNTYQTSVVSTGPSFQTYAYVNKLLSTSDGLLAATARHGIMKTTDQGDTWTQLGAAFDTATITAVTEMQGVLLAGRSEYNSRLDSVMYRSTDRGQTWRLSSTGLEEAPNALVVDFQTQDTLVYAATGGMSTQAGIYVSSNFGSSWEHLKPVRYPFAMNVSHDTLAITTDDNPLGIAVSIDGGRNWALRNTGLPTMARRAYCFGRLGNTLYVGADIYGLYGTTNAGASWLKVPLQNAESPFLVMKPIGKQLVIGAPAGVYLFDGQTITPFSEGGIDTVWDIAADQTMLYAATTKGVWRRPLSQLTPGSVAATASPNEIAVVPNPISDEAGISFGDAPASGSVRIFNTLGNEVARYDVTNDRELRIDLRALPSGCYTVMWNDGTRTLTRSVVKLTR